jgi:crotonobetainyl-CoA:carnitine CoA-transferase CaiB-like acyl-CoA transferase
VQEGIFRGLKVVDCASYIAAPAAAVVLGDFGADVIKIEPLTGDAFRQAHTKPATPTSDVDYATMLVARNKRSVALDLSSDEGRAILYRIVADADVFITNFPLPARRKLGLEYDDLRKTNERLIYASFTAYGEVGPEANKAGFDTTAYWARSGLMDIVRADAEAPPARAATGMGDHPCAMNLYAAIVTALYQRQQTGRGCKVNTSLLAGGMWANGIMAQAKLVNATFPSRPPRERATNALGNLYKCRDGRWLSLAMANPAREFVPFLKVIGREDLAASEKFGTPEGRTKHARELIALLDTVFATRDLAEWRVVLDAARITFGFVGTLGDIEDDEQMRAANVVVPRAGAAGLTINSPFEIEGIRKAAPGPAPAIGEHTAEVLAALGYTRRDIDHLANTQKVGGINPVEAQPLRQAAAARK